MSKVANLNPNTGEKWLDDLFCSDMDCLSFAQFRQPSQIGQMQGSLALSSSKFGVYLSRASGF
jgi:hypothetical protein